MKTDIQPRSTPDDVLSFNQGFDPDTLEDDFVALLRETLPVDPRVKIVSHLDYRLDTDTIYPLIVCAAGALQPDPQKFGRVSTNYGLNVYPGTTGGNELQYGCVVSSQIDVRCVARTSRDALRTTNQIFQHLLMLSPFMPELLYLNSFSVQSSGTPAKIEGEPAGEHLWVSQIQSVYTAALHWSVERLAPRLKTLGIGTLI